MDHWRSLWTSRNRQNGGHYGPLDVTVDSEGQWSLWTSHFSRKRPQWAWTSGAGPEEHVDHIGPSDTRGSQWTSAGIPHGHEGRYGPVEVTMDQQ